jgi:hypothetical protein
MPDGSRLHVVIPVSARPAVSLRESLRFNEGIAAALVVTKNLSASNSSGRRWMPPITARVLAVLRLLWHTAG